MPNGQDRWPFRSSQTGQSTHLDLTPDELIRRFLQHILPESYCRLRCFGWFHPAAKVRANRVRALLRLAPLLSLAQKQTWKIPEGLLPLAPEPVPQPPPVPAPLCPCCQKPMIFLERWQAGQTPPRPQWAQPP
ncbi:MAG: transposase [Verrucomicrobia bacterium]|nr:transposase [Verrucomicrobiota bacterium]